MTRRLSNLARDSRGAVAPTVALSLFALIGAGGIAFDYARLASLDTELQQAADQAALAAASQLDQQTGAVARATAAAQGLFVNNTLFADDGVASRAVTIPTVRFYAAKLDAEAASGQVCPTTGAITADATAKFVCVQTGTRIARYAMTPVVGAMMSGDISAMAVAGLGSAICKTPPVMFCNPAEPINNTNTDYPFDGNAMTGVGLKLITGAADAPGNFGFLETGFGSGASNLARALGYNDPPGDCAPTAGVSTKPGMNAVVMNAVNTRFDIDTNGSNTCPSGGACSPSRNSRKDLVKGGNASQNCGITGNGWQQSANPYRPSTAAPLTSGYPDVMGHPRDYCHAVSNDGICVFNSLPAARIGTGDWDRNAYFRVNYGWNDLATWTAQTGLASNATRYQVYSWELANPTTSDMTQNLPAGKKAYSFPVCLAPGVTPNANTVDRRRISAAVLNCEAHNLNGSETGVPVLRWIDLFLVEPAYDRGSRTERKDVYVEIIGETSTGAAGQTAGQVVRRDLPYLIK